MNVQTFYRAPLAIAAACMLAAGAVPALAQSSQDVAARPAVAADADAVGSDMMKLSENGFMSMRDVRQARMAIFNGDPVAAQRLLADAQASLKSAANDAPVVVTDLKTGVDGKTVSDTMSVAKLDLVPIDGQIVLADSFIDTAAKKAHVDKANAHFAAGRGQQAIDELKLAEVDTSFTRVLMPLQATGRRIEDAVKLVDAKKYYEANLALKSAEDGLLIDTITLTEAPRTTAPADAVKPKG